MREECRQIRRQAFPPIRVRVEPQFCARVKAALPGRTECAPRYALKDYLLTAEFDASEVLRVIRISTINAERAPDIETTMPPRNARGQLGYCHKRVEEIVAPVDTYTHYHLSRSL